jgi:thiamine biosynthesis protein ThiS
VIEIIVNGEHKQIAEGQTILGLVHDLNLPAERLAVEHNLRIVKREQWDKHPLASGDKLEIVQFVGGGNLEIS